jgi:hypothetical protein
MPDNKKTLEKHRRIIAGLSPRGTSSGIHQTFEKAANEGEVKIFKGNCGICGEPFYEGFVVRCSICTKALFHPACFGTHAITAHAPTSVTVVMVRGDLEDTWKYVDSEPVNIKEYTEEKEQPKPEMKVEIENEPEVEEEEEPAVVATKEEPRRSKVTPRSKKRTRTSE